MLTLFVASGASALVYEVVWTRALTLVMGNTVAAVSTVLAVYMGGLAAGSYLLGRAAARRPPAAALGLYGWLEGGIGLCALLVPTLSHAAIPLLRLAYADGNYTVGYPLLRFLTSALILLPPTIAMGGTFPVLSHWFFEGRNRIGRDVGALYAGNTAGAVAGALGAGFWLLPRYGMWRTALAAAAVNIVIAGVAIALSRRRRVSVTDLPSDQAPIARTRPPRASAVVLPAGRRAAALALGLSGCAALVYEVAWTRALALMVGPTVYAFSLMLAAFIAGLSVGSGIGSALADRVRRPQWWFAAAELVAAAGALAVLPALGRLPLQVARWVLAHSTEFGRLERLELETIFFLMLGPTLALGMAFPLAVRAYARGVDEAAKDVGAVYAANTVGAIAGSLAAGFALLATLGIEATLGVGVLVSTLAAVTMTFAGKRHWAPTLVSAALALAVGVGLVLHRFPAWDRDLMASGAYKYATYYRSDPDLETALRTGTLVYYKDGGAVTVTVKDTTGTRSLAVDGKVDASNAGDMLTQHLLGDLPLLLHPAARRACVIGLGSGVTLGAVLRYPVERADLVELSPQVVEASRFFRVENHDALADPRVRLIVGDGRNHLLLGRSQYDLIISEPSNPWMAGVANLFTREFFHAARARLTPGGILCQWAHTYNMTLGDLRSIIATFTETFPEGSLWRLSDSDIILLGSNQPLPLRPDTVAARLAEPRLHDSLAEVNLHDPYSLFSLYSMGGAELRGFAEGALLQTDDRPTLEYSGPRTLYASTTDDNNRALDRAQQRARRPEAIAALENSAGPLEQLHRGQMRQKAEDYDGAMSDFESALDGDPTLTAAVSGLVSAAVDGEQPGAAVSFLAGLLEEHPGNVNLQIGLGAARAAEGNLATAEEAARAAVTAEPNNARAIEQLASILADAGDGAALAPVADRLYAVNPQSDAALYYQATARMLAGRTPEAIEFARRAVAINPHHARALNLLGVAYAATGETAEARRAFERSLAASPRDAATYANAGLLELDEGHLDAAIARFSDALSLDHSSQQALTGLSDALERAGQSQRAANLRARHPK